MTCPEARELFSALADAALADLTRARLQAHLAACGDCAREWQRFEATVGLLRAVEPARAPAGFVDRVLAARPQPWPRRLARALLVPWPVKLPLQAAAVVLVAGLAVLIVQRSPELQRASAPEAPVRAFGTPAPGTTSAPAVEGDPAPTPTPPQPARDADLLRFQPSRTEAPAAPAPRALPDVAAPPPAEDKRADAAPAPTRPEREQAPARDATAAGAARQGAVQPAAPSAEAPAGGRKAAKAETLSALEARAAPADIEARLAAADRAAAEREVRALVARLGGVVTAPDPASLRIVVPRGAWEELARGLGGLGTLHLERRPAELPPAVRLTLQLE